MRKGRIRTEKRGNLHKTHITKRNVREGRKRLKRKGINTKHSSQNKKGNKGKEGKEKEAGKEIYTKLSLQQKERKENRKKERGKKGGNKVTKSILEHTLHIPCPTLTLNIDLRPLLLPLHQQST